MPRYEFRCRACGHSFDRRMSIDEHERRRPECPKCESPEVEQVLSPFFAKTTSKS